MKPVFWKNHYQARVRRLFDRIKNAPLIVKLFSALALFIFVPVMIVSVISNYAIINYSETEIGKSGIGKLKVAQSLTELLTNGISKDTLRLSLNSDLNMLYSVKSYQQALKNFNHVALLSKISDTLAEVINTNSIYQSISLYLDDTDFVFATAKESNNVIMKRDYRDTGWLPAYQHFLYRHAKLSWLKTRVFRNSNIYIPKDFNVNKIPNPLENNVITYICPLTPYTTKLRGAIVVNVYEEELSKLINRNNFDSEGYIGVITARGDVISHVDKKLVGRNIATAGFIQKIRRTGAKQGYLLTEIEQQRSLVTYLKTDFNQWIYIGVFPLDSLMRKASALRAVTLYTALLLVGCGLLVSFFVSRKLYHPVQKLIQDIRKHKGIDINGNENELALLARSFETIIRQDDLLFNTLEENKRNIRENFLHSILREGEPATQEGDLTPEVFPGSYFVCALICIDQYEDFILKYPKEQQYYLKVLIVKISEELFNSAAACAGLVLEREKIGLILNLEDLQPSCASWLEEGFHKVQEEFDKVCDDSITVALGNCHAGSEEIKVSFNESQDTLKRKLTLGQGRVIPWRDEAARNQKYDYPFTTENCILNYLDLGLQKETSAAVDGLIAELKKRTDLSYDNILLVFNQLLGSTVKYLIEAHISISDIFGNDANIYQQLATKETLDDIRNWLQHIYARIFAYQQKPVADPQTHFAKIMDYIRQNYKKDIDINSLAAYVGLSYSHVRKIFHDQQGENIVNYINNLRIEEAKRLLRQTNLNVNEIALRLGYNNNQSFNRFFKKYEGITPGEFRNTKIR